MPAADYIQRRAYAVPRQFAAGFNFNQFSGSYPDFERYGGYTSFTHKVCEISSFFTATRFTRT